MSSIQSLFASAVRQAPERAASAAEPLAAALADVWPRDSGTEAARVPRISRELQVAVVTFFERLQAMCPLAICVDDLHLADVYLLAKSAADSIVGGCFFLEPRQALVRRLSEPVAGMDPITQNGAYLLSSFYIQLELASRGSEGGLGTAEELEAAPMYATLGKQLRLVASASNS
jgi:hypothetical protein